MGIFLTNYSIHVFLTRNTKSDYLTVIQFNKLSCQVILHAKAVVTTRYRMKLSTNKNNWSTFTQDFEAGKFHVLAYRSQLLLYRTYSEMEGQRVFLWKNYPVGRSSCQNSCLPARIPSLGYGTAASIDFIPKWLKIITFSYQISVVNHTFFIPKLGIFGKKSYLYRYQAKCVLVKIGQETNP